MDIVEEKRYEDEDGSKIRRKFRVRHPIGKNKYRDEFYEEITHLECSSQFINNVVNPRIEIANRQREKEEEVRKIEEKFQEWKEKTFGEK